MLIFYALSLCALALLIVPAYPFLRALALSRAAAFTYAPCVSLALFSLIGILFEALKLSFAPWLFFVFASVPLYIGTLIARLVLQKRLMTAKDSQIGVSSQNTSALEEASKGLPRIGVLLLYIACSSVVGSILYVSQIDGGYAIAQGWDMFWHVDIIRFFMDTGSISSLTTSPFLPNEQAPYVHSGLYPALWHAYAAALASLLNCGVDYALNACNFVLMCVVFPSGMYLLVNTLLPYNRVAQICGAFVCPAFGAFPWKLLTYGPLLPQLAANCLVPALLALAIMLLKVFQLRLSGSSTRDLLRGMCGHVPVFAIACVGLSGLVSLALVQTSGIFTIMLFAAPLCVVLLASWALRHVESFMGKGYLSRLKPRPKRALFVVMSFLVCAFIWVGLHYVPGIYYVVFGPWPWAPYLGVEEAFGRLVRLSFDEYYAQYALSFFVCLGFGLCLKEKSLRWYAATFVLVVLQYLLVTCASGLPRLLSSGFWYTDPARIAAHCALASIPLAAFGLAFAFNSLASLFARFQTSSLLQKYAPHGLVACAVALIYLPSFSLGSVQIHNYLGVAQEQIGHVYSEEVKFYTKEDRDFLNRHRWLFDDGSLVINIPQDGSAFAFGLDNIPVQYRSINDIGKEETDNSRIMRTRLNKLAEDPRVREAVKNNHVRYVLRLDNFPLDEKGEYRDPEGKASTTTLRWDPFLYKGILAIDDETPGFTVRVSEGHRTIYEIDSSYLEGSR